MRFEILSVGHGFCAYIETDNKNLVMFDCGANTDPEFHPAIYLHRRGQRSTERLFITNYDQDHISDLPNVQKYISAKILHRNESISSEQLRRLKLQGGPITAAMEKLIEMMAGYTGPITEPPDLPRFDWNSFCHEYGAEFSDTNNTSLVTFVTAGALDIVIPGDLETAGWLSHLKNSDFRAALSRVDVFIASHHGRESGYCREVFNHCKPSVVVISDGPKQFASQEMVNIYATHASGVQFNGQHRKVLTTRSDGSILWDL
jgi:beta-lactamase superfamily II metal-dependent hydrolase